MLERGPEAPEPFLVRQRTEHHALRVPHAEDDSVERFSACHQRHLPDIARRTHRRPECLARAVSAGSMEPFLSGFGQNRHIRAVIVAEQQRTQSAQSIPRDLRMAAIGVQQRHRRPIGARRVQNQPVGADAGVAIAHRPRQRCQGNIGRRATARRRESRCRRRALLRIGAWAQDDVRHGRTTARDQRPVGRPAFGRARGFRV